MAVYHMCEACQIKIDGLDVEWQPDEFFWHDECSNGEEENDV